MTTAFADPPSQLPVAAMSRIAAKGTAASPQPRVEDDGLSAVLGVRPRLFGIAYRMLGSAAEAEDIVQDVWVRWQTTNRSVVRDATAFLVTATTRLAINVMQSARARREMSVGPWLPEPVDPGADPTSATERSEALKCAVLVLLQTLTPTERAAYVLREAFDCAYRDIADILRLQEANTRQLVTRARQSIVSGRNAPPAQLTRPAFSPRMSLSLRQVTSPHWRVSPRRTVSRLPGGIRPAADESEACRTAVSAMRRS
jgi:RNA polymerase sigma factor (sigma-70 family)